MTGAFMLAAVTFLWQAPSDLDTVRKEPNPERRFDLALAFSEESMRRARRSSVKRAPLRNCGLRWRKSRAGWNSRWNR